MAVLVTPKRTLIYVEGAQYRSAVSEELIQRQGAVSNFLALYQYEEKDFQANGFYGRINTYPLLGADGLTFLQFDCEIINAFFYIRTPGTGGTTEIDVKYAPAGSSTWTSLFTTTPKFISTADSDARVDVTGTNPATTGVTAPIFNSSNVNRDAGDALRFDIITAMTGDPITVGATIVFRPR